MDKKRLCVIPARAGSQRILNKNKKKIGGLTLVEHAAIACNDGCVDNIVVLTDDHTIAAGWPVVHLPEELSGPRVDISFVTKYALQFMEESLGIQYDQVLTLQPTCPIRPSGLVRWMLNEIDIHNAVSAVTVTPVVPWVWRVDGEKATNDWSPGPYSRSQDIKHEYYQEINAVQIANRDIVMAGKRWEKPLLLCAMPKWSNVDIDEYPDLEHAEIIWQLTQSINTCDMTTRLVTSIN